jgi:HAD superfamily hydrolase (TIGR01490 family)
MSESPRDPSAGDVAAFFDVDNTIIRGASAFHLGRALRRRGLFRRRDIARFALDQARYQVFGEDLRQLDDVRSRALGLIAGHSVAEVTSIAEQVYDDVLGPRVFPGTRRLLQAHLDAGHQVWLVTATPTEVGALVARRLGATGAIATVAESHDGVYTGRLVGSFVHGAGKAAAVRALATREGIDLARSFAYGDSINDRPLLESVGQPCAINPERSLRRVATRCDWPVREFRARTRRAARATTRAAVWAGAAWALALAVGKAKRGLERPGR